MCIDLDSGFDDEDDEEGQHDSKGQLHSSMIIGSGMVQEVTTVRPTTNNNNLFEGYVNEANSAINVGKTISSQSSPPPSPSTSSSSSTSHQSSPPKTSHRPSMFAPTTPTPVTTYSIGSENLNGDHTVEQINEAALQESFDKLVKSSRSKSNHFHHRTNQNNNRGQSNHPLITYDLVKNNVPDINYIDLNDINTNKLDANNTSDDLVGDDLDENFTLVDLQRSHVSLDDIGSGVTKPFRIDQQGRKHYNDNILGMDLIF